MIAQLTEYLNLTRRRRWSPEERRHRQSELLRERVRHAFETVPFYGELYRRHGIAPERLGGLEDLERLPLVSKDDLQTARERAISGYGSPLQNARKGITSGSTGRPMTIYYSREESVRRSARFERAMRDLGCRAWDRRLRIGYPRPESPNPLARVPFLPRLTREVHPDQAIECARRFRPQVIRGMVTVLQVMALRMTEAEIGDIRPRLVLTGGEMLTEDARRAIHSAFQATVKSFYACWEFAAIAAQCPITPAYHLVSDDLLVEAVKDGVSVREGEVGEAVITGLTSGLMPFIRFRLGDRIVLDKRPCPCGNPMPRILEIQGRNDDLLRARNGALVAPMEVIFPLARDARIRQYRITQTDPASLLIEYVAAEVLDEAIRKEIRSRYAQVLQADQVAFEKVARIPSDKSGKLRKVVSLLS